MPAGFIKYIASTKDGRTEVVLMDGESMYVFESQLDAHNLWAASLGGAAVSSGQTLVGIGG